MSALLSPPGSTPTAEDMREIAAWLIDGVLPCGEGLLCIGRGIEALVGEIADANAYAAELEASLGIHSLSDGPRPTTSDCEAVAPTSDRPARLREGELDG